MSENKEYWLWPGLLLLTLFVIFWVLCDFEIHIYHLKKCLSGWVCFSMILNSSNFGKLLHCILIIKILPVCEMFCYGRWFVVVGMLCFQHFPSIPKINELYKTFIKPWYSIQITFLFCLFASWWFFFIEYPRPIQTPFKMKVANTRLAFAK